ncbi:hypothetical protein RB195_020238 [Necator americanus]|uniref:Uncharacterized protein n=1 Tax=Necator americanus TaxID=51031 RepID=A0ABR1CK90_NECAM
MAPIEQRLNQSYTEMPSHRVQGNIFVYRCVECKKINKHTSIKVIGDNFMTDLRMLDHQCIPVERARDKFNRMSCEETLEYANEDDTQSELGLTTVVDYELEAIGAAGRVFALLLLRDVVGI